jgi:MFS family permease
LRLPETKPTLDTAGGLVSSRQASSLKGGLFLLKDPSFFIVCLLGFSTFFLRGGSSTTLIPLYADDVLRLGPGAIGLLLTVSSLLHGLLIYPSGAMSDKLGRKIVIVPAGYLVGLTLFAVPFAHTTASFATIFLLLHVAQGWGGQAPVAYVADLSPPGMRGMGIGLYRTFGDLAGFIGPVVSTSLVSISYYSAFWSGAGLWVITVVLFAYVAKETAGTRRVRGPIDVSQGAQEPTQHN